MSLADPKVFTTVNDDGSAEFTISVDDENYRFSAAPEDGEAVLEYEETLSYRGTIRSSEPRHEVWKLLMTSPEVEAYLNEVELTAIRRKD
jgi:hypothetical protein